LCPTFDDLFTRTAECADQQQGEGGDGAARSRPLGTKTGGEHFFSWYGRPVRSHPIKEVSKPVASNLLQVSEAPGISSDSNSRLPLRGDLANDPLRTKFGELGAVNAHFR
jgi:hypothetical protein